MVIRQWQQVLQALQGRADAQGELVWTVGIDGTSVRAHQHAAGARRHSTPADGEKGEALLACEALGRSRGGFTTKLHLAFDGRG